MTVQRPKHIWIGRRYYEGAIAEEYFYWEKENAMDRIATASSVDDPEWERGDDYEESAKVKNPPESEVIVVLKARVE